MGNSNIIEDFCIKDSIKLPAKYTLIEQLSQRDDMHLRDIAVQPEIDVNPEQSMDVVIKEIALKLSTTQFLRHHLLQYTRRQLDFFCSVSKHDEYWSDDLNFSHYGLPNINGLLTLYYNDDRLFCVMPKEIRATFQELEQTPFPAEWERRELVRTYARATTELYGVISVSDFVEIFNQQNTEPTSEKELLISIDDENTVNTLVVEEDYLFNEVCFEDAEWEEIEDIVCEADKKPRFIPPPDEMPIYGEPGYSPEVQQRVDAENYLISLGVDKVKASDLLCELESLFQSRRWKLNDLTRHTNDFTKEMNKDQANRFFHLLMELSNNTRTWLNGGYTPNEVRKFSGKEPVNLGQLPIKLKVGRNEPCPCGSGRKHKYCCGR